MATISQGLTTPANVVTGGTVQAAEVVTLYNTMNSFTIPDTIASLFQSAYSTDSIQTLTGPATSTAVAALDSPISVPATKAVIHIGTYNWATTAGVTTTLTFRKNGTAFTGAQTVATSTAGSGMFFVIHGAHDSTIVRPVLGWVTPGIATSTGGMVAFTSTADLPTGAWTSIGVAFGGTTSTASSISLGHQAVWRLT